MQGRVVVVGASLAGLRAVEALRTQGFAGELVLVGEERHAPYDRPPLSKQVLRGDWDTERTRLRKDGYDALGVRLELGVRAQSLDSKAQTLTLSEGRTLGYDGLVIATGAEVRRPPWGAGLAGIHVLRTLDDALALRAELTAREGTRVCVIGAGFIGLEVAASCRAMGLPVTVIEPLPVPLSPKLGEPMARVIAELHRERGVDLRTGLGVADIEGEGRVQRVRLSDGNAIECDVVVAGLGVKPATAWLDGSGVAVDDGVLCDATCATSVPNVVAAGDVARWPNGWAGVTMRVEHWTHAVEQAQHAVKRLLGGPSFTEPFSPVPYFWSDQYDLKIQFAGYAAPGDEIVLVDGTLESRRFVALYGRGGRVMGVLALGRPAKLIGYRKRIVEGMRWDEALAERVGAAT
jgi:3-phenylpropionate/trans-cinnamate dioxygenase ferredoxin reductase subunit